MATRQAIVRAFYVLDAAGYPGGPARDTDERLTLSYTVWLAAFAGLSDGDLSAAIDGWIRSTATYWPRPGQLFDYVPRFYAYGVEAEEMWSRVMAAAATRYRAMKPGHDFSWHDHHAVDAATQAGVDALGGWSAIAEPDLRQVGGWDRAAFRRAYDRSLARARRVAVSANAAPLSIEGPAQSAPTAPALLELAHQTSRGF